MLQQVQPGLGEQAASPAYFHRLLVAQDFSELSNTALRYARELGSRFHSRIDIAYIQPPVESAEGTQELRARLRQAIDDVGVIVRGLHEQGIQGEGICRVGNAGDVLVQLAAELRPDLLLLGAYGHRLEDNRRLGSTAEYLLRWIPCPTLVIGPRVTTTDGHRGLPHCILYASSLPAQSGTALNITASVLDAGGHVEVVHVLDPNLRPRDMRPEAALGEQAERLIGRLLVAGIDASWRMCAGAAAMQILERADELRADLIVFGIEHRPANPDVVGLLSDVIQGAPCAIMTVPGPA